MTRSLRYSIAAAVASAALVAGAAPAQAQAQVPDPQDVIGSVSADAIGQAGGAAVGLSLMPLALSFQMYCIAAYNTGGPGACSY